MKHERSVAEKPRFGFMISVYQPLLYLSFEMFGVWGLDVGCIRVSFNCWKCANSQHKKLPRHTEGLLSGDMFPINYFSVSEVSQRFDDFQDWFQGSELPDSYWRFNRIHSYGAQVDPPPLLGPAYSSSEA